VLRDVRTVVPALILAARGVLAPIPTQRCVASIARATLRATLTTLITGTWPTATILWLRRPSAIA
jgi:hypothetical protein